MKKKTKRQHKLKTHKLQMFWEVQEKARRVELWRLLNDKGEHDLIPMDMFRDIYTGDLAVCLRKHLIPPKQVFHIECEIIARNDETGEEVKVEYTSSLRQQVTLWQFLEGSDDHYPDEVIYKDNGSGIKTRWNGFNAELEDYLATVGDDDYVAQTNHCILTCHTTFKSFADERDFYKLKDLTSLQTIVPKAK